MPLPKSLKSLVRSLMVKKLIVKTLLVKTLNALNARLSSPLPSCALLCRILWISSKESPSRFRNFSFESFESGKCLCCLFQRLRCRQRVSGPERRYHQLGTTDLAKAPGFLLLENKKFYQKLAFQAAAGSLFNGNFPSSSLNSGRPRDSELQTLEGIA